MICCWWQEIIHQNSNKRDGDVCSQCDLREMNAIKIEKHHHRTGELSVGENLFMPDCVHGVVEPSTIKERPTIRSHH